MRGERALPGFIDLFPQVIVRPMVGDDNICQSQLLVLGGLHFDSLQGILLAQTSLAYQPPHLDMLWRVADPDRLALIAQRRFQQFDRFDHDNVLLCALDQNIDGLTDVRMDDRFELF